MLTRSRRLRAFGALVCLTLLFLASSPAPAQTTTQRVRFARGRTTTVLRGSLIRGERINYVLGARAGQLMIVHITSREQNAVFDIRAPRGALLAQETTDWEEQLPRSGDYVITVGGTRGNTSYTLEITLR